jgi:hypothetical protein
MSVALLIQSCCNTSRCGIAGYCGLRNFRNGAGISGRAGSATADVMASARELAACAYPPMRLAPANSSAQRPAEASISSDLPRICQRTFLRCSVSGPYKRTTLQNMDGSLYGSVVRDRDGTPYPGSRDARVADVHDRQQRVVNGVSITRLTSWYCRAVLDAALLGFGERAKDRLTEVGRKLL